MRPTALSLAATFAAGGWPWVARSRTSVPTGAPDIERHFRGMYTERAHAFFAHRDQGNSERVVAEIDAPA